MRDATRPSPIEKQCDECGAEPGERCRPFCTAEPGAVCAAAAAATGRNQHGANANGGEATA